jgi:hypothetical protein
MTRAKSDSSVESTSIAKSERGAAVKQSSREPYMGDNSDIRQSMKRPFMFPVITSEYKPRCQPMKSCRDLETKRISRQKNSMAFEEKASLGSISNNVQKTLKE